MSTSTQGYGGPYGAMASYYGNSQTNTNWPQNMGGSNGINAFQAGVAGQYLNGGSVSTLPRRIVCAYSNVSSVANFTSRPSVPGVVVAGARVGPQAAFFPNRNGKTTNTITTPY